MFDRGLTDVRWTVSWAPPPWQTELALPLLVVLLLIALVMVVKLLPAFDRLFAAVGRAASHMFGLLAILPEYLITTLLRRLEKAPPGVFHTYGAAVGGLVGMGRRVAEAGFAGFTTNRYARRCLIAIALAAVVLTGNAHSCPPGAPACSPPVVAWWNQTKALVNAPPAPPARAPSPAPAPHKTTKKPAPKRTSHK
jgi:hypothetical protein